MAKVTFIHSSAGYISLMKSGAMRGVLHGYSDAIDAAANGAMSPDKGTPLDKAPYRSADFTTSERAGVRIQTNNPHGRAAEAKYGYLQSAAGV